MKVWTNFFRDFWRLHVGWGGERGGMISRTMQARSSMFSSLCLFVLGSLLSSAD